MYYTFQRALAIAAVLAVFLGTSAQAAESFLVADNQTGHILQSSNENRKLPIGSLTQLATSLVALDWMRQASEASSTPVTVSPTAATSRSSAGLQEGDVLTFRDLLYCTILASDNVAANTLAEYAGSRLTGSSGLSGRQSFVAQMNALARQLGMKRTLFLNADGSDRQGKQPYSTAADIARLVRYAYASPEFPFYVNQTSRVITINRMGKPLSLRIRNTNTLLGNDRIDGAKVGFSPRAGQCLALTADRSSESARQGNVFLITPRRLIIVLLRSTNGFSEGLALLRQGWTQYEEWAANGRPTQERNSL